MSEPPEPVNVLLVDDHENNLLALRAVLQPLGQRLVEASSGSEALTRLESCDFAVILLDVQMPGMDGLETAIRIKRQEKLRHIPILFLTAHHQDELDVFKGYSVGAVDYMFKPLNPDILRSKVRFFIDVHRKNEESRRNVELLRERRERDIEELRRANEQRYRGLADSMPQIVWTATATGLISFRNRRWYECARLREETDEPAEWGAVVHPDDLEAFEARWQAGLEEGRGWEGECRFGSRISGAYRWHLVRVLAVRDSRGQRTWIGSSTDIDDQKRAEQSLVAANRAKDEFLAVLSHELRTPLNAILGWVQLLLAGGLDDARRTRALETIDRNARGQAQLIADLLDVSRIVSGKLAMTFSPVAICRVVEQAIETARPVATAARVELETDYRLAAEEIEGDADRLQQVVSNLLSNAIKFTPAGGRVRVMVASDADAARIVVDDSGKGIDAAFLPHVFERFRQADDVTTRPHGGLGLGLAIVQHLVAGHGGSVTAESEGVGKGARFTVTLPLLGSARFEVRRSMEVASSRAVAAADLLREANILVVEDDDDGRELLELLLCAHGARVRSVASASAALDELRHGSFDAMVSDIGLPNEDGYALVERAREISGERVVAVAVTAYASHDDKARALAAGFDAHVTKPVTPEDLVRTVGALVRPALERRALAAPG